MKKQEKPLKKSDSITIIGSSDGPTSVFLAGGHKRTIRQSIQKKVFGLRKKWFALWIKPKAHTMDEVVCYIKEKYNFTELSKDTEEYRRLYDELRTSFIIQYKPELLGEYSNRPELTSKDETGIREFLAQMEIREQKAKEVPEELFSLDYHYLEMEENDNHMNIQLESHFGYIGGGFRGINKRENSEFEKIYKDVYKYYGVSEDDIVNNTKRYENLLRTLAIRH